MFQLGSTYKISKKTVKEIVVDFCLYGIKPDEENESTTWLIS